MPAAGPEIRETISLLLTVKNEAASLPTLLPSIREQSRLPDELIIIDGGSDDGTYETLLAFAAERSRRGAGFRVLVEQLTGANISQGRNAAVARSRGSILAITDAGVVLPEDWLENITAPLRKDREWDVVSGFFHALPKNAFELALSAVTLPLPQEINRQRFLPSSRSIALRRPAWERVGGYPEWLDYGEDLILDLRLRARGARFLFLPTVSVGYRPRKNLPEYGRQYFRYARGDGKANLWPMRHAVRYSVYLLLTPALIYLGIFLHGVFFLLLLLGALLYLGPLYRRLPALAKRNPGLQLWQRCFAWFWVAPLRAYGDLAKMLGYPLGWWWRLRHRPPPWRP
ncbi:MAG: glycosyltransferase [Chloroflexi bacterium]|nr:glycosyltransferase [Chloroflexota bacterium]